MSRIAAAFTPRPALMPYLTLGYPDPETSLACVQATAEAGANLIELGLPFSDPLADGPVIQHSTQVALENGVTVAKCLQMTTELRRRGVVVPLLLMGYYNPIFAYGLARFAGDAASAGADGFIVPDLPLEEADELEGECRKHDLSLIYMLAPTSTPERIKKVAERASGFLYLVSVTGVTGERSGVAGGLREFVGRVKEAASVPVAVGFGISTPAQAVEVGQFADGVIIGSAIIKAASGKKPVEGVKEFVRHMRKVLG
ncbi:MAG: tryptophan synthase subunit alpha [Chloroflexi bacterium]|nr:tryptophan synthase subunit alpha [Chloroflexota bacterium]